MKLKIVAASAIAFASTFAGATTFTCANARVYYNEISYSGGPAPRPGMRIGNTLLVYEGKVKVNVDRIYGLNPKSQAYVFELTGEEKALESTGNGPMGSKIFKQMATIYKMNPANPAKKTIIAEGEEVVCTHAWAYLP